MSVATARGGCRPYRLFLSWPSRAARGSYAVIGVGSWSTGPALSDGYGGLAGVTPIELYRGWVLDLAAKLGSPLAP